MTDATPVQISGTTATLPLTRTQQLIWTSQRLNPEVPLANMGKRFRISGPLDADRFIRSFDAVVRACDVLRTVIVDRRDVGRQSRPAGADRSAARVLDAPPSPTELVELSVDELDRVVRPTNLGADRRHDRRLRLGTAAPRRR